MRIYLILLVVILIAALMAPYFLKGPDGQTLMKAEIPVELLPGAVGEGDTVYRWKDAQGVWQFGEAPPEGIDSQPVVLENDARITPLGTGWQVKPLPKPLTDESRGNLAKLLDQASRSQ